MRTIVLSAVLGFLALLDASAGRLDIAVIQFPEEKTVEELNAAFAGVSLFGITNSNRTMTKEPYLKGGYVLFVQSLPASPGSVLHTSTRLKDNRADVEGRLGSGSVSVTVTIMGGVKAGLRQFEKTIYSGQGPLPGGAPRVLSMRRVVGKAPKVLKGQARMESYNYSTVVVAQYTP